MQCMEYSKIWLNLIFAALSLTFIRGQKAFPVFHADRVIIRLPCGQGQLSRILKVQCYSGADLGGGCRGCAPPPPHPRDDLRFSNTTGILQQKKLCGLLVLK